MGKNPASLLKIKQASRRLKRFACFKWRWWR